MTLQNTNGKTHIVKINGRNVDLLDPKEVARLNAPTLMKLSDKDRAIAMGTASASAAKVGKRTHLMSEGNVSFAIGDKGNQYDGNFVIGGIGRWGVQMFGAQWISLFALIGDAVKLMNKHADKLSFEGNKKYEAVEVEYLTQFVLADEDVQKAAQAFQDAVLKAHKAAIEEATKITAETKQNVAPTAAPPAGTTTQPEGPALEDAAAG